MRLLEVNFCDLYVYLKRVLLPVVHKGNNLLWPLDAIDGYAHFAVPGADL